MNRTTSIIIIIAVLALTSWGVIASMKPKSQTASQKIPVAASFYPLAHFAEQVGGDFVTVSSITPSGTEPHDYEPTPQEIIAVQNADVFIFNGAGLDPWAEHIVGDVEDHGGVVVEMANLVELLPGAEEEEHAAAWQRWLGIQTALAHGEEEGMDPHFWLDPTIATNMVEQIRDALIQVDAIHANDYRDQAAGYLAKLQQLDQSFQTGLAQCSTRKIYTSHAAFAYLAKRYTLEQVSISGISPEEEPSAGRIAELAKQAKAEGITTIFFETLVSPALANTLAEEIGAKTAVLDPIEGVSSEDAAQGANYLTIMQNNLTALRTALGCS